MTAYAVILSGGSGTRLWPLSRANYPKQFLPLVGEDSLLQKTAERSSKVASLDGCIVVCNEDHRFIVGEQLRSFSTASMSIVLEPAPRNTAPAVALSTLQAQSMANAKDAIIVVLPSDHLIRDTDAFAESVEKAITLAREGHLVAFGIKPTEPATGFGYLQRGEKIGSDAYQVRRFIEKPDLEKATEFCGDGSYYWNSGMFAFRCDIYQEELDRHRPDIMAACRASFDARFMDLDFTRVGKSEFEACESESIDYAVMEVTERAAMVPLQSDWNDVGSWSSLMQEGDSDENGNVLQGDVRTSQCAGTYIRSSDRLVAAIGLQDIVIVDTADALLVASKADVQDIKELVAELDREGRPEATQHRRVYRPWGSYETVDLAPRFQVKRIIVNPGEKLSLQMHHHRAEHWIVVGGTAIVTRDSETFRLTENESTFIPLGATHRLENPGKMPLEMIEVQSGSYLGEDDIVRFEDGYGRA